MIKLNDLNDIYIIEHLSEKDDLSNFVVNNIKGKGLQDYLRLNALVDEEMGIARTYLVKDAETFDIVAYFTLRTGLITISRGFFKGFDAITGIELANFAVNDAYREANDCIPKLGSYIFYSFVLPLVKNISEYVGAYLLYIYAIPENRLIEHYQTMGFKVMPSKVEKFVYRHVKPAYDKNCKFMVQEIDWPTNCLIKKEAIPVGMASQTVDKVRG